MRKRLFIGLFLVFIGIHGLGQEDTVYESEDEVVEAPVEISDESEISQELLYVDSIGPVNERRLDEKELSGLKTNEDYWYANQEVEKKKQVEQTTIPPWLDTLLWIVLIGVFIALLVWFLSTGNIFLFKKRNKAMEYLDPDGNPENIFEIRFEEEIDKAIASGNYRMAVRMMYLQQLKLLAERSIIQYAQEKTNSQYLFQLSGSMYYPTFFRLTRHFDYVWYGKFELSENSFALLKKDFDQFKNLFRS